jgi:thiamine biosynthesis lipoprotein
MKKHLIPYVLFCLLMVTCFGGCAGESEATSKTGLYFDTVITLTLYGSDAEYLDDCFALAQHYEDLLSRTKEGTDIWNINHSGGQPVTVSQETFALIRIGLDYCEASNGLFDITVGALSDLWDFTSEDPHLPDPDDIRDALASVDYHMISMDEESCSVTLTNPNAQIDLGGIAKGYIADQMKTYLLGQGVSSGILNLGGNILCIGAKSTVDGNYNVAIQKPFSEDGEPIASLKLKDQSVVTSGTYQRYFTCDGVVYHHILDLSTGYPMQNNLSSVTIISSTSVEGDALSTTCFLMGLDEGMDYIESLDDVEAIFITDDDQIYCSSGMDAMDFSIL